MTAPDRRRERVEWVLGDCAACGIGWVRQGECSFCGAHEDATKGDA
jgi:hypothetical protein